MPFICDEIMHGIIVDVVKRFRRMIAKTFLCSCNAKDGDLISWNFVSKEDRSLRGLLTRPSKVNVISAPPVQVEVTVRFRKTDPEL